MSSLYPFRTVTETAEHISKVSNLVTDKIAQTPLFVLTSLAPSYKNARFIADYAEIAHHLSGLEKLISPTFANHKQIVQLYKMALEHLLQQVQFSQQASCE